MTFKHNAIFTDTCDCCGVTFEPWLLVQVHYGEWWCASCVETYREEDVNPYTDELDGDLYD